MTRLTENDSLEVQVQVQVQLTLYDALEVRMAILMIRVIKTDLYLALQRGLSVSSSSGGSMLSSHDQEKLFKTLRKEPHFLLTEMPDGSLVERAGTDFLKEASGKCPAVPADADQLTA